MAARQSARHDVARACFRFHDRHVRFARNRQKIVGASAAHETGCSIMIGQCDLVQYSAIELQWSNAATNECTRFNRCTQRNNTNMIPVADLKLTRKLGRNFCEHLRL
jgi:hypothetical protein